MEEEYLFSCDEVFPLLVRIALAAVLVIEYKVFLHFVLFWEAIFSQNLNLRALNLRAFVSCVFFVLVVDVGLFRSCDATVDFPDGRTDNLSSSSGTFIVQSESGW